MGYLSDAYRDLKWLEKMRKEANIGKRDFKQIIVHTEKGEPMSEWIPIKTRPMDDDERRIWSEKLGYDIKYDEAVIFVSQLPDDGQEVLTCDKWGRVRSDTFFDDGYGCYLEDNGDMDGIVAWMPLPEPYGERRKED